jgi:hypothetical protein
VKTLKTGKEEMGIGVEVGEIDVSIGISYCPTGGRADDAFEDNLTFVDGYSMFPMTGMNFVWLLDFTIKELSYSNEEVITAKTKITMM